MYHCLFDWTRQAVCFTILLRSGTIGVRDGSMDRDVTAKRTCLSSMFRTTRWSAPQLLTEERRLPGHIAPTFGTTAGGPSKH